MIQRDVMPKNRGKKKVGSEIGKCSNQDDVALAIHPWDQNTHTPFGRPTTAGDEGGRGAGVACALGCVWWLVVVPLYWCGMLTERLTEGGGTESSAEGLAV